MFCNGFVCPLWAAIVYLLERKLWECKWQKSPTESHWLTQADFKSDALAMQEAKRFRHSVCSLIQQTQSQRMQAWLILTASIQLQSSFSLLIFSCYFADKIAQNLDWVVYCHGNRTVFSRDKHCKSPLLVLQSCLQKLEVLAWISAITCKLDRYPTWQGRARWEIPDPLLAASSAFPP